MPPPTLGGSLFVHDAIRLDYCAGEAVDSLCALCDEVVVLDAQSTDGTLELLEGRRARHPNLRVVAGAEWECAPDHRRLAILANRAKSLLSTDWHFMLQADEVIHEASFPAIRRAIQNPHRDAYIVRRVNLFGDLDHCLRFDLPLPEKVVGDRICRLARTRFDAIGDAESIGADPAALGWEMAEEILIYHYGFVRDDRRHLDKTIEVQGWFFGPGSRVDPRVLEVAARGDGLYDWRAFKNESDLQFLPRPHPVAARPWVDMRRAGKRKVR